jgi:Tol biopolymer transport system component
MELTAMRRILAVLTLAALCGTTGSAQKPGSPDAQLGAIIRQAEVELDFEGAIPRYTKFIAEHGTNAQLTAKALYHRGLASERVASPDAARADFERVATKFSTQKEAGLARERLGVIASREMVQSKIWSGRDVDPVRVSPDGRYIVYAKGRGANGYVVHDLLLDTNRTLDLNAGGRAYDPFLPDSKHIFYTWFRAGDDAGELRIVNLDGTGMRSLIGAKHVGYDVGGVTADGKLAAVGLGRDGTWEIGLLSLETKRLQILKNLGWRDSYVGNFSPDGRWLVYSAQLKNDSPEKAVYVIATDGSVEPSVVVPSFRGNDFPYFTPDGSRVVFLNDRSDSADLWSVHVKDGKPVGDPEKVKMNIGKETGLGFSHDGTYYHSEFARSSSEFVVQVDPSTWKPKNEPARLSDPFRYESVQAPYWSLDGKRLAYLANVGQDRFVIHDFDSGQDRELPTRGAKGSATLLGWSADGKSLQVAAATGFRLVDTETQQDRLIPLAGAEQPRALSTDGKKVFYAAFDSAPLERSTAPASDSFRLRRRDLDTGADNELYRAESARTSVLNLMPSPDGRSLAFTLFRQGEKSPRLWILPLSGGEPRELLPSYGGSWTTWTQDSRAILFVSSDELWVQPIDGREPYATGITFNGLRAPSVSPDGGRIAFIGQTTTTSVWMIKNLFPDTPARSVRLKPASAPR